jgi:hypothetical protein
MKNPETTVDSFKNPFNQQKSKQTRDASAPKACTFLYSNVDSFSNKKAELELLVDLHKPNVIGLTEIKPKNARFEMQEC